MTGGSMGALIEAVNLELESDPPDVGPLIAALEEL
jgi:hypothetical protein